MLPPPEDPGVNRFERLKDLKERYTRIFARMQKYGKSRIGRNALMYSAMSNPFTPGDYCWYFSTRTQPDRPGKLTCKWTRLWRVCQVVNDVIIRIKKANSKGPYIEVPIYKVLQYEGRVKNIEDIPSPEGMELDMDY